MPRGGGRKIEVPTDTQPQLELGDTADIERRRREREERDDKEETAGKGQREGGEREGREHRKKRV